MKPKRKPRLRKAEPSDMPPSFVPVVAAFADEPGNRARQNVQFQFGPERKWKNLRDAGEGEAGG